VSNIEAPPHDFAASIAACLSLHLLIVEPVPERFLLNFRRLDLAVLSFVSQFLQIFSF
jgi:hypothetical protein